METPLRSRHLICFGAFEFDPHTGELRKHGMKLKLHGHAIDALVLLLEHPGELVTREELQKRLWPADTFVDFEHNLNAAVKRLREELDDSADKPRFIETLPRHGYRFIAPVNDSLTPNSTNHQTGEESPSLHSQLFSRCEMSRLQIVETSEGKIPDRRQRVTFGPRSAGESSPYKLGGADWRVVGAIAVVVISLICGGIRDRLLSAVGVRRTVASVPRSSRLPSCPWKISRVIKNRNTSPTA